MAAAHVLQDLLKKAKRAERFGAAAVATEDAAEVEKRKARAARFGTGTSA